MSGTYLNQVELILALSETTKQDLKGDAINKDL